MSDPAALEEAGIVPDWPAPAGVRAAVSTRHGPGDSQGPYARFNLGAHSGDDPGTVAANRERLREALALPGAPHWVHQMHGTTVVRVDVMSAHTEPTADAAVTATPGAVLTILTADCLPVLFCADDGSEVAAAHAGWRGLSGGVLEATVAAMQAPPDRLMAWLGPCIGAGSYEVGAEVRTAFVDHDGDAAVAFVPTRTGHWHCDLAALARRRLAACGLARVHGGGFDTLTDARFYSYRRDGAHSGRFASLIWLEDR